MINKVSKNNERQRRHARIRRKISGTAACPRLNVFRSNKHIHCQIVDDDKGTTLVSCSSVEMKLANGSNVEAAKAVGAELAKRALDKGIEEGVFHARIGEAARKVGQPHKLWRRQEYIQVGQADAEGHHQWNDRKHKKHGTCRQYKQVSHMVLVRQL